MTIGEWSVVFYTDDRGNEPVREFLLNLDWTTRARFDWSIEQLRIRNTQAREPLVRHLEGKTWELRRESDTNIYRLLYAFGNGRQLFFLHGFQKKTQKTPSGEIEIAQRRLVDFTARSEGDTR